MTLKLCDTYNDIQVFYLLIFGCLLQYNKYLSCCTVGYMKVDMKIE